MRIIFLNSWFGKVGKPYFDFIKKESSKTDIFCFMEYTEDLFGKVSKEMLQGWQGFLERGEVLEFIKENDCQAIFTTKNIEIIDSGRFDLYKNDPRDTGFASFIEFSLANNKILLVNVHGKAHPGDKKDIPERISQSQKIINFCKKHHGSVIIGGDFNLMPDTKSVKMFEEVGYTNLIKEFNIKETRGKINHRNYEGAGIQHFADYVFVSKDIKVKNFSVPNLEISDHLPLILEFDI